MLVVPLCADAEWLSANKSPQAIPINLLPLILCMIHVSFSSPSEEWQRRAFEVGLLTYGLNTDLLSAPSRPWDSGFLSRISLPFTVARAVAVLHRSSRSPLTHRDYQRRRCEERSALLQLFPCQTI